MKNLYKILDRTSRESSATSLNLHLKGKANYSSGLPMFLKTLIFTLVIFVAGIGSLWGQITTTTYNFSANSTGWTGNFSRSTLTNATMCGTPGMRRNLYSFAPTGNLVSPLLAGTNNQGVITLSYKYKAANYSSPYGAANPWGSFNVQVGNSATGPWTTIATVSQQTQTGACITQNHTFTPPAGNLYIKWDCFWTAGDYYLSFDDVSVSQAAAVACSGTPAPGATIATPSSVAPSGTSVLTLATATPGTGVTYQWQSSATLGGTYANVIGGTGATTASYTTAALTANTWFRCRVICGANTGISTPAQVTLNYCTPTGTAGYYITNVTTTGGATNIANTTASNAGYGNFTAQSASNYIGTGTNFSVGHSATAGGAGVGVWIDWNNDMDFADVNEQIGLTTGWNFSPFTGTINIPVGTSTGNKRMRIVIDYNLTSPIACPVGITGETEDYTFAVVASVPCSGTPVPGNTLTSSASVSSGSTVNLSLSNPPTGSGLTYQWQSAPSAGGTWANIGGATSATYTATVTAMTWYRCIVTCAGSPGTSVAVQVTLTACIPNSGSGCSLGDLIASVQLNTLINNSGPACVSAYNNYYGNPALTTTLLPSSSYNCVIGTSTYGQDFAVWIDYNDDLVFDVSERVGYTTSTVPANSSATFNITLACTPPPGPHTMRVRSAYATAGISITPCGTQAYGEVEDYKITIASAPACASPGIMTTVTPSTTSATLTWATNCSFATNYDFQYGPTGFTLGTGTILTNQAVTISAPNASFNLTGLTQNTTYQVYYRANCGGGVYSAWSTASSITTLCTPSGDEVTSGVGSWLGYVYNSAAAGAFTTYKGYVTEAETFNTLHATTPNGATVVICPGTNSDLFAVRYKMTKNFANSTYVFTVGGDDGVRLYVNGTLVINGWINQGYTTYSSAPIALSGNANLIFEFYENVGSPAQSSFSYAAAPVISSLSSYTLCPNATVTIAGSNFTGITGVSFNGVAATSFTVVSSTSITAVVPASVTAGSVTVTNSVATATSSSYTVNTIPATPTVSVSGGSTINFGGTANLTATTSGGTISWYTSPSTILGTGTTFATPAACTAGSTTYYAIETGACSSAPGSAVITVNSLVSSTPSNGIICNTGGSVTLNSNVTGGSAFNWSPATGLSSTNAAVTVASPTTTTQYTLSCTTPSCGAVSQTFNVGVISGAAFTPTALPTAVCEGNPSVLSSNLASSGFTYATTTFSPSTPVSPVILCNACGVDDGSWNNVPIPFTYNFFGNNYTTVNVGSNGVLQFGSSAGLGQYTYNSGNFPNLAYPANVIAAAAVDLYFTSGSVRYFTDGIAPTRKFVIEYFGVAGYSGGSNTVQIKLCETTGIVEVHVTNASAFGFSANKVVGLQDLTQTIGATAYSNTATITNTAWKFIPGANYTFQWSNVSGPISGATATTYNTGNLSTVGANAYSVSALNPNTGCASTQSVSVTVNATPAVPVSSGDVTNCSNITPQTLTATPPAGAVVDWYNGAGSLLLAGSNTYSVSVAGTYYAKSRNTTTGCTSASIAIQYIQTPAPAAPTVSNPAAYCQNALASALTATATGANTLNWYTAAPSAPSYAGATGVASAPTPSTASAGTTNYYVSQTSSANGCQSQVATITVTVNATPSAPTASNPAPYCQNAPSSALTATATGGGTLYWYTDPTTNAGQTTTAPTPSTATAGTTNYYVSELNASGCESARTTITVTVTPSITASVTNSASSTSACGGGSITFTATPTNGGTPNYQWYLNGNPVGGNSPTYTMNQASDNASNYSGSWNNGSNQGVGMGAWSFSTGANSGVFIGNPANDGNGTAGIGTSAHGMYATGSAYLNTTRSFTTPMQIGDQLRFYWVFNWDANGGNKGFDLISGGTNIFNVNNSGSAVITAGAITADGSYGTTPMYVQITRTSSTQYTFTMTRRSDGSTYSSTFNNSNALDGISFYIGGQNNGSGQRNLYFNGLEMRSPQANDQIYVSMTPSAQTCLTSASATNSNTVTLSSTASTPTVSIQSSTATTVCTGTNVTFSVLSSANMGATPTYQWFLNGSAIGGATSSTYSTTGLVNSDVVTLAMTSSLSPACLTSSTATSAGITYTINPATAITTSPVSAAVCVGGSQNFSVVATGTGTLTYQWQKNEVNITGNATALTNQLTLSSVGAGDVASYTVVVTGTCSSATSSAASLTLNTATSIGTQPVAITQCATTTAVFTVVASGQGTLTYQWRKDGSPLAGETAASLSIANISLANAGNYSVVVTGTCGSVTSSNAALSVNPATTISSQPVGTTICASNTANFSVTASGQGTLTYQWQLNGSPISGATSSTLSVTNAQAANAGSYTVVVTGGCGSITSNAAVLVVNPLTAITTQPAPVSACLNGNATFTVVAAGTGTLTYQWKKDGVNITGNASATTSVLTLTGVTAADAATYSVVVSGGTCGVSSVTSNLASILSLSAIPTVTANVTTTPVCLGSTTTLSGGGASTYSWDNGVSNAVSFAPTATTTYTVTGTSAAGCTNTASILVTVNTPTVTAPVVAGTVVWNGATSVDFGTSSNWLAYNGTTYAVSASAPTASTNVIIPVTQGCVAQQPAVLLSGTVAAQDVVIESGATLSMASGVLNIHGNYTNNGTLVGGTGTVAFVGASGNQSITKTGGETFPTMIVNKAAGNVILSNNVTVTGSLTLTNGLLEVGTNDLVMGGASLNGGSSSSYVKTASSGVVKRNVAGTATTFPIGNGSYNPATLTNAGTADVFSLRMIDNVTSNGTGVGATTTEAVVNRTWMLEEATVGGSNVTLRLQWNGAGEQINTFSPSSAFIAHYIAGASMWDNIGGTVGADYVESAGITSFSPFTISSSPTFAPLPVELLSLDAQCAGENVIVSWKTASEHNSLNFVVERSENGTSWSEIQTVGAAGNSNTIIEYAIEDAGAARGVNYYRLIQTDQDGAQKVYGPVMSNCGSEENMFMSFPNPSDADITLMFTDKKINGSTTLTVRDAHGRVVRSMALEIQPGTTSILIPDMELEPAVYYLQLVGDNFTSPVIKHSLR